MKPYPRAERVGGHIQRVLSEILQKETADPRLDLATVSCVRVTRDLRLARVYFALHGSEAQRRDAEEGFRRAKPHLKRRLAAELSLRYMPELEFHYDETFDHAARIERILKTLQQENAADHRPTEDE